MKYAGAVYRFCDVALLKPPTEWKTDVCRGNIDIFLHFAKRTRIWQSSERRSDANVCAQEWKIEVDIFNTFDIYWCIELNSEYVAIFLSLSSSLSYRPNCARNVLRRGIFELTELLRWGKIINIEAKRESREKNWFEILMCFGCTPYVKWVCAGAQ